MTRDRIGIISPARGNLTNTDMYCALLVYKNISWYLAIIASSAKLYNRESSPLLTPLHPHPDAILKEGRDEAEPAFINLENSIIKQK